MIRPPPAPEGGRAHWVAKALDDSVIGTSRSERLTKATDPKAGADAGGASESESSRGDESDEIVRVHSGGRRGTTAFERDLAAFRELLGEGRKILRRRAEGSKASDREVMVAPPEQQLRRAISDEGIILVPPAASGKSSAFEKDLRAMRELFSVAQRSKPRDPAKSAAAGGAGGGASEADPLPPGSSKASAGGTDEVTIHGAAAGKSAFERDVAAVRELFAAQKVRVGSSADIQRHRSGSVGVRPLPPGSAKAVLTTTAARRAPARSHRLTNSSWPIVRDFWAMVDTFRTMFD